MSRSLIQTVNQTNVAVGINTVLPLGSVQRRYGCNLKMSGNGIEVAGEGYYSISATVTIEPTAAGTVTLVLHRNGVPIPGAIAQGTAAAAGDSVTLPLQAVIRQVCCREGADNITVVLTEGPGVLTNNNVKVIKE